MIFGRCTSRILSELGMLGTISVVASRTGSHEDGFCRPICGFGATLKKPDILGIFFKKFALFAVFQPLLYEIRNYLALKNSLRFIKYAQ